MYGDHFLQTICRVSQELNVGLDAQVSIQTVVPRKIASASTIPKKLTPAKFEAWKMWYEDGLSIQKIANFPARSTSIKEQTVLSYLLEAIQEGLPTDWPRLCEEVDLTPEMFANIRDVVTKVGSDKLKPIKDELPENVSYAHIKICISMLSSGFSPPSKLEHSEEDGVEETNSLQCKKDRTAGENGKRSRNSLEENEETDSSKRLKTDKEENYGSGMTEATEDSVVDFLKNHENGVGLHDILQRFRSSSEESVLALLSGLEGGFEIFKKNGMYRPL